MFNRSALQWRKRICSTTVVVLLVAMTLVGFSAQPTAAATTSVAFPKCFTYQIDNVGVAVCVGKQYPQQHRVVMRCANEGPWGSKQTVFGPWTRGKTSTAACTIGQPEWITYQLQPSPW